MDAPKRIWAWPFNSGWHGGYYRENKHAIPEPEKHGSDYILVSEHDRLMAEKDAEIARLREALLAQIAWLEECTGEGLEGKDAALVAEIAATLGDDNG